MSDTPKSDPEKITIKQLLGLLTPSQFRACLIALIGGIGGVFAVGMWVNQVRLEHKFAQELTTIVQEAVEKKNNEFDYQTKRQTKQIEFLERCMAYLNASTKGKESAFNTSGEAKIAKQLFVQMLERMYHQGDPNLQKADGYQFDESDAGKHNVIFENGKKYSIPSDVKGSLVERSWNFQR